MPHAPEPGTIDMPKLRDRLVGQLLVDHLPEVGKLVLVHIPDVMIFAGRMRLIGGILPWPYWEIAGTEGERLRRANPRTDAWCYMPEIELPNHKADPQPASDMPRSEMVDVRSASGALLDGEKFNPKVKG